MSKYSEIKEKYDAKHGEGSYLKKKKVVRDAWRAKQDPSKFAQYNKTAKSSRIAKVGREEYLAENNRAFQKWRKANRERFNELHRNHSKNHPEVKAKARRNWYLKLKSDPIRYAEYLKKQKRVST